MKLRDAMKIYGLDTEKEEVAENAASSSASFKRRSVAETLNNYRTFRAGDLRHRIESWQAQYDGLAQGYNNGTKSAEELKRAWSVLKPEGEKLSAELRSSGVFEEETVTELADTMDGIISSFSDAVAPKAAVTDAPKVTEQTQQTSGTIDYSEKYSGMDYEAQKQAVIQLKRTYDLGVGPNVSEGAARASAKAKEELDWLTANGDERLAASQRREDYIHNKKLIEQLNKKIDNSQTSYDGRGTVANSNSETVKSLKEERDRLLAENTQYERTYGITDEYAKLKYNDDFADLSQKGDIASPDESPFIKSGNSAGASPAMKIAADDARTWEYLTDDERATYYYIHRTQGEESAVKYITDMAVIAGKRKEQEFQNDIAEAGTPMKVLYSALSVPAQVYGGIDSFANDLAHIVTGQEINPYSAEHDLANYASSTRTKVSEAIAEATEGVELLGQNIPAFLYQTGMSMADSMLGAFALGKNYTAIMGMNAASSEAKRLYEEGASKEQIALGGLFAGAAEAVFEKVSLDNLLKEKDIKKAGQLVKEIFKQGGVEASEEVFTEISNKLANHMVMGGNSDYSKAVEAYIAEGKSRAEAEALAFMNSMGDIILAGAGGFISGAGMGAVFDTVQYRNNVAEEKRANLRNEAIDSQNKKSADTLPVQDASSHTSETGAGQTSDTSVSQDDPGINSQYTQNDEYDSVAAEIELENAAREYVAPETPDMIAIQNSGRMVGASQTDISCATELAQAFGRNIKFFSAKSTHNGYFDKNTGEIYVNANSNRAVYKICAHEMTHALEMTPEYEQIKKIALKELQKKTGKSLDALRAEKREVYEKEEGRELDDEYIDHELVAEYAGENLFSSKNKITSYVRENPRVAHRFIQWLEAAWKAVTRDNKVAKIIRKMLGDARVLWADAVRRVKAEGHTPGEGVRHSIETDDKGRSLMLIDKNIFEGVPENKRGDTLEQYIADNFGGTLVRSSEGYPAHITERTAGKMKYWNENMDEDMYFLKLQAGSQIDELFSISRRDRFSKNTKSKNAGFAKHGWDYFKSYFSDGENVYEADISSAKTDSGNVLYNIGFIREVGKYKKSRSLTGSPNGSIQSDSATIRRDTITRTSAAQNGTSDTSISQDDPRVNSQYTQNSGDDSSDVRHSYSYEDGVDVFDENRGEESQEIYDSDEKINKRMRRDLEKEGEEIEKERLDRHYGKDPITVEEYKRRSKNGGFVSMADQAEAGEIEPAPKPGTAAAVGKAAAKKMFGEDAPPEKIKAESERLASEAEVIKTAGTISRPSNLIYGEDEQTRLEAAIQINGEIYKLIEENKITPFMQSLASDIASGKKDVTHIPAGVEVRSVKTLAELYSALDDITNQNTGHSVLQSLGIKICLPLVSDYRNAPALRGWEKARKIARKNVDTLSEDLTPKELRAAQDIAEGFNEIGDYSSSSGIRDEAVILAASAIREANKFTENGLAAQRAKTVSDFEKALEEVISSPQNANKRSNARLVSNTFYRNNIAVFGDDLGARINEMIFRPIETNETERMRFVDSQNDEFKNTFGRVSNKESELVQSFIEAGISPKDVQDVKPQELIKRVKATLEQETTSSEKASEEKKAAVKAAKGFDKNSPEKEKAREAKRFATAARNRMTDAQKVYNAISAAVDSNKKITSNDIVRIANMAEWFRAKYAIYYEAINDFLVVHGYEPIGFIKNYAPHMQEENMNKLGNILRKLGFDDNVSELPTEIAGRTDTFKPGKKWNPHFQSRQGGKSYRLDALAGFDSYLSYMSEVLYHTDDVQKLRQFSQYLRASMSSDEVKAKINSIRKKIRMREIDEEQGNKQIDEELGKIKNTNLSPYVTVLDNYTNIMAGKQSKGDRGIEDDFGRRYLNVGNFIRKCFVQSSIVGNASSALAQTVQLPWVIKDCGLINLARAIGDVMTGHANKVMEFDKRSDFIRGKKGTTRLQNDKWFEWIMEKGMIPFEFVDDVMSGIYVRAKFYQLTRQKGMDVDTALLHADRFADNVIGSRVKGAKPVIFHNKNFFQVFFTTFQVEPANALAHITQDMPLEFRTRAKEVGVKKAAWEVWGRMLTWYMLSAFLLNWLFEELYGQTPVQFDVPGYIADGIAAGFGTTRSDLIKKTLCSGFEKVEKKLGITTPFDFSKNTLEDLDDEFDWFAFGDEIKDEVISDIPFLSAALGVLGYSDSRLPMPKIEVEKIRTGLSNMKSKDEETREKGWVQLKDGVWSSVKTWVPFGNQANKVYQGYKVSEQGGSYDYSGRLQYPVGDELSNELALVFGPQAFNENNEFWAAGGQALSERATEAYEALLDSGMRFNEAFSLAKEMSALQADEKPEVEIDTTGMDPFEEMKALFFTDYSTEEDDDLQTKVEKQVELLNSVEGLTSDQKYIAFKYLCADDKVSQMMTRLAENGADPAEAYDVMSELAITKDTEEAPRARAEYLRESSLTGWEKSYVYYTSLASKSERETIEALRELNEGEPIIYETLDDLDIEDARGGDGTAERKRAIVMNSDLTDKGKYEMYSRLFVDDDESGVKEQTLMDELISAGVDAGEVTTVFSGIKDGKTDAEKAQVLLDSKLTLLEIEKVYFEKIVTPSSREKKEEALESVIDAGGNVEVYLKAYIATAALSWKNGDWKKGETLGKAKAYKKAIDGVTKDRRIRRALYDAFDVSEQVW